MIPNAFLRLRVVEKYITTDRLALDPGLGNRGSQRLIGRKRKIRKEYTSAEKDEYIGKMEKKNT